MDMGNVSHATAEISPRIRWAPSVGENGVYLFAGDLQLCFGSAEALDSINAMAEQLDVLRGLVLAAMVTPPVADPSHLIAGLTPDEGDHYVREAVA